MPIYMKIEGYKGPVKDPGVGTNYFDCFEINSVKFGPSRRNPNASDRESAVPSISEIVITKPTDSTSANLFKSALMSGGKKVTIAFVKNDGDKKVKYMEITLTDTMISSYNITTSGDKPLDSMTLNFTKIEFKYVSEEQANDLIGTPETVGYDMSINSSM